MLKISSESSSSSGPELDSPPSSPNKNAAFSRLGPDVGRLPDLRNGDTEFGGDGFVEEADGVSGSSIHEKLDCAILDRVGTGAFGLEDEDGSPFSVVAGAMFMLGVDGALTGRVPALPTTIGMGLGGADPIITFSVDF